MSQVLGAELHLLFFKRNQSNNANVWYESSFFENLFSFALHGLVFTYCITLSVFCIFNNWNVRCIASDDPCKQSSEGSGTMGCKHGFAFYAAIFACFAWFSCNVIAAQTNPPATPFALIQTANIEGSGLSSLSQAFPNPNTAGDLIIAFVRISTTSQTVQVSDSAGNVYKEAVSQIQSDDGHQIHIFYAANVLSGVNTITANFSGVNNHPWLAIFEYSGVAAANPLDVTSAAQGNSIAASSGDPVQTRTANELVFAGVGLPSSSSATINAGGGFSLESQDTNTPGSRAGVEDQITTSTGPVAGNFSLSAAENWTAAMAAFTSSQLTISTASLPQGVQGAFYKATIEASGGATPYAWTINGSLPSGMSFDASGVISGTPTSTGSYNISVQVRDAHGNTATQPLQIQVNSTPAPIFLVQSSSGAGSGVSTLSQAFPTANTAGNLIIAFVRMSTTSQAVQISDTSGNVYQDAVQQAQSADGHQTHIFYAANIASGVNTVTVSFSETNNHPWLAIYEYSGLDPVSPLDKTAHAEGFGSAVNSGSTQSTSSSPELIFAGVGLPASSAQTVTADSGFTLLQQDAPPDNSRAANEQVIVNTTGSYASSFILSDATNWTAELATFRPPAPAHAQLSTSLASVDFGSITSGSSSTQSITVTNVGTASASITQLNESGTGFSASGLNVPYNLAPNASTTFQVTFAPISPGTYSGTATLISDATNSPLSVALNGTATQPSQAQITANPSGLNFGIMSAGNSATQRVTLTNSGTTAANVSQITVNGMGFAVSGITAPPFTLAAGAAVGFQVTFSTAQAGSYAGNITITSDAANSPLVVSLSGTATHSVSLSWIDGDSGIAGYSVYRANQSGGPYSKISTSLVTQSTWTDGNVQSGNTYYYVVTATGASGLESAYSSQVAAAIPNP